MNGRHDHEASFRRPVDSITVFLLNGSDELEIANTRSLDFLRTEEGYRGLRRHSCCGDDFGSGDQDESVAFRLPSKIDDCVFDRVDDLYGYAFLLDSENLEIRG